MLYYDADAADEAYSEEDCEEEVPAEDKFDDLDIYDLGEDLRDDFELCSDDADEEALNDWGDYFETD